jgi:hypothetical protein
VNRHVVFINRIFRASSLMPETLLPHRDGGHPGDGPALFAGRLEDVGNIPSVARLIIVTGGRGGRAACLFIKVFFSFF